MAYQVTLTPKAQWDLVSIYRFIARNSASAASNFCEELTDAALSLRELPERNPKSRRRLGSRRLVYKNYLIFHDLDLETQQVQIPRFCHAARDRRRMRLREESETGYGAAKAASGW